MAKMARMDGDGVGVNKEVQSSIEKIDEIQNNLDRSVGLEEASRVNESK